MIRRRRSISPARPSAQNEVPLHARHAVSLAAAILPPVLGWAWLNVGFAAPLGIWFAVACMVIVVFTSSQRRGVP
jgi:hypothetical protein